MAINHVCGVVDDLAATRLFFKEFQQILGALIQHTEKVLVAIWPFYDRYKQPGREVINNVVVIDRHCSQRLSVSDIHHHEIDMFVVRRTGFFDIQREHFFAASHELFRKLGTEESVSASDDMLQFFISVLLLSGNCRFGYDLRTCVAFNGQFSHEGDNIQRIYSVNILAACIRYNRTCQRTANP